MTKLTKHSSNHNTSHHKTTLFIDSLTYVVGVGGNLAVIPQIMKAWQSDAPGLSVLTWLLFTLFGFVWLAYAIIHKAKPLIVAQAVGISCNLLVVAGWAFNHWVL